MADDVVRSVRFLNEGTLCRGMFHLPLRGGGRNRKFPAVLLCHGLTGHHIETHQLFVKTSRALAATGIASMRFDFRGSGESEGAFEAMTVTGEVSDALAATERLVRERTVDRRRLGILGLSLGGMVTALVLGRTDRYKSAALWSAVARSPWRERLTPEAIDVWRRAGSLNLAGNYLGIAFFDDLERQDALGAITQSEAHVLVVHGTADASVPLSHARDYERALAQRKAGRSETLLVEEADHTFSSREWERAVIDRTVGWFQETL